MGYFGGFFRIHARFDTFKRKFAFLCSKGIFRGIFRGIFGAFLGHFGSFVLIVVCLRVQVVGSGFSEDLSGSLFGFL